MSQEPCKSVAVTGADGFIGRNLMLALSRRQDVASCGVTRQDNLESQRTKLQNADVIFHLAGINRPQDPADYQTGNVGFTQTVIDAVRAGGRKATIVFASSTQAELDNPYGKSKREAEEALLRFARESGTSVHIFRLTNVFGKWCRPDYNSAVATFCHNIARDLPVTISDRNRKVKLIYIDDVVRHFLEVLDRTHRSADYCNSGPVHEFSLGELVDLIRMFRQVRTGLLLPDFGHPFVKKLYATYLSYLEPTDFDYSLDQRTDPRGALAELMKSEPMGQIFISRTHPGITRGNHYHETKTEKFCVVEGNAIIRFRHVHGEDVISYPVTGDEFRVIDIPPGYTHSIENVGDGEMVVLFWASEPFDPDQPDTYPCEVIRE